MQPWEWDRDNGWSLSAATYTAAPVVIAPAGTTEFKLEHAIMNGQVYYTVSLAPGAPSGALTDEWRNCMLVARGNAPHKCGFPHGLQDLNSTTRWRYLLESVLLERHLRASIAHERLEGELRDAKGHPIVALTLFKVWRPDYERHPYLVALVDGPTSAGLPGSSASQASLANPDGAAVGHPR